MMPAYNAERFVAQAIDSALAQRFTNWELIVVDDGSVDRTAQIVDRYAREDERVTLVCQSNRGEAAARNVALDRMHGEFVAFLDADDLLLPRHLEASVEYLDRHPEYAAVYSDGYYITEGGQRLKTLSARRRGPMTGHIFDEVVRGSDVLGPPLCVVLRRDQISRNGLRFDPTIVIGPDWDFFVQFAEIGDFGYIDEVTCLYRVHDTNITVTTGLQRRRLELAKCRMKAIKRPGFSSCSLEVRVAVFHDLLVNCYRGEPETQRAVVESPEFLALPEIDRARLLRLMASGAILSEGAAEDIQDWLGRARRANPADPRTASIAKIYGWSPRLCRMLISVRRAGQQDAEALHPFADLKIN